MLNALQTTKFDRFEIFIRDACEYCQNSEEDCCDFTRKHPICYWADEFNEAKKLCKKLDETEAYYEHLAEITPEDEYDFNAESKVIGQLEGELEALKNYIASSNEDNLIEYHKYFGYEM